jgi:hypothetical protein
VQAAADLVWSPVLRAFPHLRIALSEGGIGWIPYFLERIDYVHDHHHHWTLHNFPKGKKPSDVFREHVVTCFIDDAAGVRNRDLIGVDNITWECDYPHSDSTWPEAPETLWATLQGVPDEDIHKMTWQNTTRHFRYDPFKHIPKEQCTVGALRAKAKHVDLTPRVGGGGKQPSDYAKGYATIGDIMQQLATVMSTPFDSGANR